MYEKRYFNKLVEPTTNRATALKPYQFKDLLTIAGEGRNGLRNVSIIWHLFASALRCTEASHLKVKDVIDKDGSILKIGRLPAKYTKTGYARKLIQVEKKQRAAIKKYALFRIEKGLRITKNKDEYLGLDPESPMYLARGQSGFTMVLKTHEKANGEIAQYWSCSSLQQIISSLMKRVGVTNGSSHSGRRTLATRLNAKGISDFVIQDILGHANINQTMDYIDPDLKKLEFAISSVYKDAFALD